eukprot:4785311-Amphidinium_carterae.1
MRQKWGRKSFGITAGGPSATGSCISLPPDIFRRTFTLLCRSADVKLVRAKFSMHKTRMHCGKSTLNDTVAI